MTATAIESKCSHCGTSFVKSTVNNRFCSTECRVRHGAKQSTRARHIKKCVVCGSMFTGRVEQMTCSSACGRIAGRGRMIKRAGFCSYCHKEFKFGPQSSGKYCSRQCAYDAKQSISKEIKALERIRSNCIKANGGSCLGCGAHVSYGVKLCGSCKYELKYSNWRERYCKENPMKVACIHCGAEIDRMITPNKRLCLQCTKVKKNESKGNHRRRARRRGVACERISHTAVFIRDNWTCGICGKRVDRSAKAPDPLSPSIDHVIPFAKGGSHTYGNVQCAHFGCNSIKGARVDTLF